MDIINFEDFAKLDIRIGKILSAEKVEGADKLLKLEVDFGPLAPKASEGQAPEISEDSGSPSSAKTDVPAREIRQILAGIAQFYAPEDLIGKECPFVYNLAPRTLRGFESQGMILCTSSENGPVLLHPDKEVPPGSVVK
jgi:tRNA-binding EMAP/Myf-like protein